MKKSNSKSSIAAASAAAFAFALALPAFPNTYVPPKLVKQAAPAPPIAGTGAVTVQVFIKKNGSVGSVILKKSTNHGDDAAALDIAKNSTYKPGVRDGKPIDAFYTMALRFNGSSLVNDTGTTSGELLRANALIRANKFPDAKAAVEAYLGTHPNDQAALQLLGVADSYLADPAGAADAFDKAGTISSRFKLVAAKAYTDAAVDALKAKNNDRAIALAEKALGLSQNVNTLYVRGTGYANAQRYAPAIADFEKAKTLATAGHADTATQNAIDGSLVTAYLFGGQPDKGIALAKSLKQRDPSNTRIDDALAGYYNARAVEALKAGKTEEAVTLLESAAAAVPSRAVVLYVQSANALSQGSRPDWKRVKAEAEKALALNPNDARANYVAGIAAANAGDRATALTLLQRAKANAGTDPSLAADIDTALRKVNP